MIPRRTLICVLSVLAIGLAAALFGQEAKSVITGREFVRPGASVVLDASESIGTRKWLRPAHDDFDIHDCDDGEKLFFSSPTIGAYRFVLATALVNDSGELTQDIAEFTVYVTANGAPTIPPDGPEDPDKPDDPGPEDPEEPNDPDPAEPNPEWIKEFAEASIAVGDPSTRAALANVYAGVVKDAYEQDLSASEILAIAKTRRQDMMRSRVGIRKGWDTGFLNLVTKRFKEINRHSDVEVIAFLEAIVQGLRATDSQAIDPFTSKADPQFHFFPTREVVFPPSGIVLPQTRVVPRYVPPFRSVPGCIT